MTTSVSATSPTTSAYSYTAPTNPVNSSSLGQAALSGLSQTAVTLSAQGGIVASLGGGSLSGLTYDATGLFNSLIQAGAAASAAQTQTGTDSFTQPTAQQSLDQGIAGTLASSSSSSSTGSGIYSAVGAQANGVDTSTNWANALQSNPALAATVAADSLNQGIVGSLSTFA